MAKTANCPTCGKEILANAPMCCYCGDCDFIVRVSGGENQVARCGVCYGKGWEEAHIVEGEVISPVRTCGRCEGSGAVQGALWINRLTKDTHVRESSGIPVPRPASWGAPPPRPAQPSLPSSGCASIILLAFTLASALLIAILI